MKQFKSYEFKILLIGILVGIILTFLVLKILNIPVLLENQVLSEDSDEFMMDYDNPTLLVGSDSADLEQF